MSCGRIALRVVGAAAGIEIRAVLTSDAAGLARTWEDAREYSVELAPQLFVPPDPGDVGLGDWLVESLLRGDDGHRLCLVAAQQREVVGFITARLEPAIESAARQTVREVG